MSLDEQHDELKVSVESTELPIKLDGEVPNINTTLASSDNELKVSIESTEVPIKFDSQAPSINATLASEDNVIVLGSSNMGPQGPPGPQGQWTALTQVQYDALVSPNPETLYVIVG